MQLSSQVMHEIQSLTIRFIPDSAVVHALPASNTLPNPTVHMR